MRALAALWRKVARIVEACGQEVAELSLHGPRARLCLMASLTVVASVAVTSLAQLPDLWWAGISGFMSLQATNPASVRKSILRLAGTAAGALLALLLLPVIAYDHVAFALTLWGFAALGILGFAVSRHGYAWLFFAITFILVTLLSMDDPLLGVDNAFNRTAEVAIGSLVAVVVTWLLALDEPPPDPAPDPARSGPEPPPGWGDLLGARFSTLRYALRAGFAVMLMPLLWRRLELPSLVQMPVTVAAVMAVPVAVANQQASRDVIVSRGLQRIIGCLFGGLGGLLLLAVSPTEFLPWLGLVAAGIWLATHVQSSTRGVGYVGTQGAVAFILTMVQGAGPSTSILPGVDRFVGVTLGVAFLLGTTVLLDLLFAKPVAAPAPQAPSPLRP